MKKILTIISLIILTSCGLCHHLPPETNVSVRDSVRVEIRDSINWIPKERIVDIVPAYDSLKLETSLAKAIAYVDTTTHTLKGSIENKQGYKEQFKEKIVYKEKRDTTIIKVPVEVVKEKKVTPRWAYWTLVITLLTLGYIGLKIYLRLRTKGLVK